MTENPTTPSTATDEALRTDQALAATFPLAAATAQASTFDTTAATFAATYPDLDAALAPHRTGFDPTAIDWNGQPASPPTDAQVDAAAALVRFTPGYEVAERTRILRSRLYADEHGVATADFEGTVKGLPWIEATSNRGLKLYAEIITDDTVLSTMRIALVPTGKRVPADAVRLGGANGTHAYLLDSITGAR